MSKHTELLITSDAFKEGENIPRRYTCEGDNINPPLEVNNMPQETQTIAIIMDDPDAPRGLYTHWIAWNLPPDISVPEGREHHMSGTNSSGKTGYYGPCPPSGIHRYFFHVYALDTALNIDNGSTRETLEDAMNGHILARGTFMGRYQKISK